MTLIPLLAWLDNRLCSTANCSFQSTILQRKPHHELSETALCIPLLAGIMCPSAVPAQLGFFLLRVKDLQLRSGRAPSLWQSIGFTLTPTRDSVDPPAIPVEKNLLLHRTFKQTEQRAKGLLKRRGSSTCACLLAQEARVYSSLHLACQQLTSLRTTGKGIH